MHECAYHDLGTLHVVCAVRYFGGVLRMFDFAGAGAGAGAAYA